MADSNSELRKIRARLRSYKRKLQKEKEEHGFYRDAAGKRYRIGPHHMLPGEDDGALAAFQWFEKEFSDDVGQPGHLLCWSLALHRAGDEIGAAKKLRQSMLSNLHLVPYLPGSPIAELDIWHGSSNVVLGYIEGHWVFSQACLTNQHPGRKQPSALTVMAAEAKLR